MTDLILCQGSKLDHSDGADFFAGSGSRSDEHDG